MEKIITSENFETEILKSEKPILTFGQHGVVHAHVSIRGLL